MMDSNHQHQHSLGGQQPEETIGTNSNGSAHHSPTNSEMVLTPRHLRGHHTREGFLNDSANEDTATITSFSSCIDDNPSLTSTSCIIFQGAEVGPTKGEKVATSLVGGDEGSALPASVSVAARPRGGREVLRFHDCSKHHGNRFNKKLVFDNFNLSLREGEIYGLLGASGCGKTTALSCIVGLNDVDKGRISIFGNKEIAGVQGRRIGYMPQEIALYKEFTISETIRYFGRIYGMNSSEVKEQMEFLLTFLELPPRNRIVGSLSGGQQRRMSFAVSLLHKPEMLILDEPTVGVDPMLRQSIWNYMRKLADAPVVNTDSSSGHRRKFRTSIIITTHYIEEVKMADMVGLMANGRLLAQENPAGLMAKYRTMNLEDVFLKLCIADKKRELMTSGKQGDSSKKKSPLKKKLEKVLTAFHSAYSETTETSASAQGKGRQILANVASCGGGIGGTTSSEDLSSVQPISYTKIFPQSGGSTTTSSKVSSVEEIPSHFIGADLQEEEEDPDNQGCCSPGCCVRSLPSPSRIGALIVKNLIKIRRNISILLFAFLLPVMQVALFCVAIGRDPSRLAFGIINHEIPNVFQECTFFEGCEFQNLSCRYLNSLQKYQSDTFDLVRFDSEDKAIEAIKAGEIWGVMSFKENFTDALVDRFLAVKWSKDLGDPAFAKVRMDMTNQQIAYTVKKALLEGFENFTKALFIDCAFEESKAELLPIAFGEPVYGSQEPVFTEFMAPGTIVLVVFFLAVGLTGQSFTAERKDGLLQRSAVAGVTAFEIVFAQITTQFLVMSIQIGSVLVMILVVFDIKCHGPLFWIIFISVLQGIGGMSFGFLLSALFRDESVAIQAAIGTFYPQMILSGILWPLEGLPYGLKEFAIYLPSTLATQAVRDIMSRGWGITVTSVYLGVISSSVWIVVFLVASWMVVRTTRWN